MRVCVVGSGVIGTIFGLVIAQAGNDVTHYLKPGSGARLREGVEVNLLDARGEPVVESSTRYSPPVVERLDGGDGFVRMPTLEECGPFVDALPDSGG